MDHNSNIAVTNYNLDPCLQPPGGMVLKVLKILVLMSQLANKDGRTETAAPGGKGILSIMVGSRQLQTHVHSVLKITNLVILWVRLF